jgi:hypothetical protein
VPWANDDVTPAGNPAAENEIGWAVPFTRVAVIIVTPERAGASVIVPPFASEKSNEVGGAPGAAVTVKVKVVLRDSPSERAVTVIGKLPARVDVAVWMVTTVAQFGLQLLVANDAVVPAGSPLADSVTP